MSTPSMLSVRRPAAGTAPESSATPKRFLSLQDVLGRLTISRSLLYDLIKDPIRPFPAPVHIGRRSVWIEAEVEAYMRAVVEAERGVLPN
jgi:prophage regulatory protein